MGLPTLNKQGRRRKPKTPGSGARTVTEKLRNLVGIQRSQRTGFILTLIQNTWEASGLPWSTCALKIKGQHVSVREVKAEVRYRAGEGCSHKSDTQQCLKQAPMSQTKRAASTPDAAGRRREFSVWAIPWWKGTVCTEACQNEKKDLEL